MAHSKGVMAWYPRVLLDELQDIRQAERVNSRVDAIYALIGYSREGRKAKFGSLNKLKPLNKYRRGRSK